MYLGLPSRTYVSLSFNLGQILNQLHSSDCFFFIALRSLLISPAARPIAWIHQIVYL